MIIIIIYVMHAKKSALLLFCHAMPPLEALTRAQPRTRAMPPALALRMPRYASRPSTSKRRFVLFYACVATSQACATPRAVNRLVTPTVVLCRRCHGIRRRANMPRAAYERPGRVRERRQMQGSLLTPLYMSGQHTTPCLFHARSVTPRAGRSRCMSPYHA